MQPPKKSLGQHWLADDPALRAICDAAGLSKQDTVLEIGPGPGNLTKYLVKKAGSVVAVELDEQLAGRLSAAISEPNLKVVRADILKFDLTQLPAGYKTVANIPYYLTSKLLRALSESPNPPSSMTLLVQQEVAERICAGPGNMSILAVSAQLYYSCGLGIKVPARLFVPPPKVDSQVVMLERRQQPLFPGLDTAKFFRIVKAGFSEKRKKLRSSLSGGLGISKEEADKQLAAANIKGDLRAQQLSLGQWFELSRHFPSA
ncbi:MAG TPA: 16S rRNA (adenine(1518)-N(6)/adenine(1519)-N(6))-dimethyltransferase RsmA [Candidatus Saccharimonadales bacterium]|nr:16S rRNA (adenine(1518)-N(6)/adenine(1519)-N(6))-dimethyltransferase RsmA [Candidatus Saccharimonadales bacterium]